jgi:hypothetical protein
MSTFADDFAKMKMLNEICSDLLQNSHRCIAKATLFICRCNAKSKGTST